MSGVGQVPDHLDNSVLGSGQLVVLIRGQLPQTRAVQSCGVDTEQVDHHSGFIEPKLLHNLMDFIIHDSSFTQNICLCFRREGGEVQLRGQVVSKMLGS